MDQPPTPLPPVADLRFCSEAVQEAVLDLLFEPSPAIHSLLVPVVQMGNHASYDELIDACRQRLRRLLPPCPAGNCGDCTGVANRAEEASTTALLMAVIGSHPRLGAKHVGSVQSAAEQASLRGEGEALAALNSEYEEKFSGLRYVVFVNGRDRADIMRDMRARIDRGDYAHEVETALEV